jgi:hypothetical protein
MNKCNKSEGVLANRPGILQESQPQVRLGLGFTALDEGLAGLSVRVGQPIGTRGL